MHLECSIPTPLFSSVRASTTSTRVPPVLLATLVLLATGCSTTHRVSHDPSNGYGKVTNAAAGETARIHLRDGRTTKLDNLYVDADSTTGVTPQGTKRAFPTSAVREIEIVNRGKGILQGAGIGAIPLAIGGLLGASTASGGPNDLPLVPIAIAFLSLPGTFVGGIIGGIRGARETYRFSNASPEADSAQAALRTRLPANRHRAAEHP